MTNQIVSMARGTSRQIVIPVTDDAGNPFDLTGGTAEWWVGQSISSTGDGVVIKKSTDPGGGITISQSGSLFSLNIVLDPPDTEQLPPRMSYYHEAKVVDAQGGVYVVASGTFELDPALTTT